MTFATDLAAEVQGILGPLWNEQGALVVPEPEDLALGNHTKTLADASVLYADLDGSTSMVDTYPWWFSAEVYKIYLLCAARIIRDGGGSITAYDGDRVMAVFMGDGHVDAAVRAAARINFAVQNLLQPALNRRYPDRPFALKHCIGIDKGSLRAARIGIRKYNDIVWVGRPANYAAKLTSIGEHPLWITGAVFDATSLRWLIATGLPAWTERSWTPMNKMRIYCTDAAMEL